jgi:hypothetical protein
MHFRSLCDGVKEECFLFEDKAPCDAHEVDEFATSSPLSVEYISVL